MAKKKTTQEGTAAPKAKRAPAKKKTSTKAAPKSAGPAIVRAPSGREFYIVDGRVAADLKELGDALDAMAEHVWTHHVNAERNDFANWVHDVFEEAELAKRIRAAASKNHAQILIYRHILERS